MVVFFPIPLIPLELISKAFKRRAVEPFGLPFSVLVVGSGEIVPHLELGAYSFKQLRCKLRTFVGGDEKQGAVNVNIGVEKRVRDDRSSSSRKRDAARKHREPLGYYE